MGARLSGRAAGLEGSGDGDVGDDGDLGLAEQSK